MTEKIIETIFKNSQGWGMMAFIIYIIVHQVVVPAMKKKSGSIEELIKCTEKLAASIIVLTGNVAQFAAISDKAHTKLLSDTDHIREKIADLKVQVAEKK